MTQSKAIQTTDDDAAALEAVLISGDLSRLSSEQRVSYYNAVCKSTGLNPLTNPFSYLKLSGKLTLYALKNATDQIRALRNVSLAIVDRSLVGDVYSVTVRATMPNGRFDEDTGSLNVKGLHGEALSNAHMKTITKAKRRVTLSICSLGMLDESEIESIPGAVTTPGPYAAAKPVALPPGDPVKSFDEADADSRDFKWYAGAIREAMDEDEVLQWLKDAATETPRLKSRDLESLQITASDAIDALGGA